MRVMVLGTGVIGTIYGYVLSEAGHEVTHYVRPGKTADLKKGIRLRLLDGRKSAQPEYEAHYDVRVTERLGPADGFDLYLVSVRHYQIESVLPLIATNAGGADVLFFNNIWTELDAIDAALPRSRYLWGFPVAGGGYMGGMLDAALLQDVRLGEVDGSHTGRLDRIADAFRQARLSPDVRSDILHWQWVHFAINAGVIGTALKVGSAAALLNDVNALEQAVLAVRDALEVCRARGVQIDDFEDAAPFFGPANQVAGGIQATYARDKAARKIMERHAATEDLVRIYDDVLQSGLQLGVSMPNLLALEPYVTAERERRPVAV